MLIKLGLLCLVCGLPPWVLREIQYKQMRSTQNRAAQQARNEQRRALLRARVDPSTEEGQMHKFRKEAKDLFGIPELHKK